MTDEQLRELLGDLDVVLEWRDGERPRHYGTRIAMLRSVLCHAAATGDLDPLLVHLRNATGQTKRRAR